MRFGRFSKNLKLFTIANFATRASSFILLPIYSNSLSIGDFGLFDLIFTLLLLLMPLVTISVYEAVQKYNIENPFESDVAISTALIFYCIPFLILGFFVLLVLVFDMADEYSAYLTLGFLLLVLMSLYELLMRHLIGTNKETIYAQSSIVFSTTLLVSMFIFLYKYSGGLSTVIWCYIGSYLVGCIYLMVKSNLQSVLSLSKFNRHTLKTMLRFSAPLSINASMWWIFDVSDRWILLYFKGVEQVGLYSVANKLNAIVIIIHVIIFQAWQVSAIDIYGKPGAMQFFKRTFLLHYSAIFIMTSIALVISKDLLEVVLSADFAQAWAVTYPLLIATAFFCLSSFFGVFYVLTEKTSRVLVTSVVAAIINIILNFILIPYLGLYGAAYATVISTLALLLIRSRDAYNLVNFKIEVPEFVFAIGMTMLIFVLVTFQQLYISIFVLAMLIIISIRSNKLSYSSFFK